MSFRCRETILAVILAALVAGCGQAQPTATPIPPTDTRVPPASTPSPVPTATPTPQSSGEGTSSDAASDAQEDAPSEIEGMYGVAGHQLYLPCLGTGSPTVITEAGYNDTGDTWSTVQAEVAKSTRACAYDRAGLGRSDPGPESATSLQVVYQLHKMLGDAGLEGPYVLVGHSLGGQYMRKYAGLYQEEVAGLVLVDSSHPDQFRRSAAVLPTESPNESESTRFYREWFTSPQPDPTLDPRLYEPGSLGDMPLVVLTAPHKEQADDLPAGLSDRFDEIWVDLHEELALLSSNSTHIMVEESGHFIQHDEPELVIEVILGIVDAHGR